MSLSKGPLLGKNKSSWVVGRKQIENVLLNQEYNWDSEYTWTLTEPDWKSWQKKSERRSFSREPKTGRTCGRGSKSKRNWSFRPRRTNRLKGRQGKRVRGRHRDLKRIRMSPRTTMPTKRLQLQVWPLMQFCYLIYLWHQYCSFLDKHPKGCCAQSDFKMWLLLHILVHVQHYLNTAFL